MKKIIEALKKYCPLSLRSLLVFLIVMGFGAALCSSLQQVTTSDTHVPIIFVLMVLIIALLTDGYFYGILAAVISVFAVNWAYTYPYMKLDFTIYGYPLTFITMLAVGVVTSMLASRHKEAEKLRMETLEERMRASLLRSVSHDLRTPLTSISGSISAVLDDETMGSATRRELLSNARDDADWMCRMVENLLSATHMSAGSEIAKSDELIEEVIVEAVQKFRVKHPDITVSVRCPDEPIFVPLNVMLTEQLIMNLLDNAVIHGGADEITVTVKVLGDGTTGVYVRDNGRGIDPKLLPHLFDGSLEPGGEKGGDGNRFMGIGLAVCSAIAKAHGGSISAHNPNSGGAEFLFTLSKGEANAAKKRVTTIIIQSYNCGVCLKNASRNANAITYQKKITPLNPFLPKKVFPNFFCLKLLIRFKISPVELMINPTATENPKNLNIVKIE